MTFDCWAFRFGAVFGGLGRVEAGVSGWWGVSERLVLCGGFGAAGPGGYPDQAGMAEIEVLAAWIQSAAGQSRGPEILGLPCGRHTRTANAMNRCRIVARVVRRRTGHPAVSKLVAQRAMLWAIPAQITQAALA